MSSDDATILDILAACRRIRRFVEGVDRRQFGVNEEKHWAVASQLLIVGEAVKRLSDSFRDRHPDTPWQRMAGMRNRLIHEYDKINWELVWRTATSEMPSLHAELDQISRPAEPDDPGRSAA